MDGHIYMIIKTISATRVSFKDSSGHLVKTAETAFDPWGLKLTGIGNVNEFQYRWELQGKEAEQTFGLNTRLKLTNLLINFKYNYIGFYFCNHRGI